MKTSRTLILRHLTMVALALGIALLNVGSTAPVALGYYVDGPVSAPVTWGRLAENAVNGLEAEDPSATALAATVDVLCGDVDSPIGLIAAGAGFVFWLWGVVELVRGRNEAPAES